MSFDRRVTRMEHRVGSGGCPDCGHTPGGKGCATPEEVAALDEKLREAFARLNLIMRSEGK